MGRSFWSRGVDLEAGVREPGEPEHRLRGVVIGVGRPAGEPGAPCRKRLVRCSGASRRSRRDKARDCGEEAARARSGRQQDRERVTRRASGRPRKSELCRRHLPRLPASAQHHSEAGAADYDRTGRRPLSGLPPSPARASAPRRRRQALLAGQVLGRGDRRDGRRLLRPRSSGGGCGVAGPPGHYRWAVVGTAGGSAA